MLPGTVMGMVKHVVVVSGAGAVFVQTNGVVHGTTETVAREEVYVVFHEEVYHAVTPSSPLGTISCEIATAKPATTTVRADRIMPVFSAAKLKARNDRLDWTSPCQRRDRDQFTRSSAFISFKSRQTPPQLRTEGTVRQESRGHNCPTKCSYGTAGDLRVSESQSLIV